MEPEFYTMAPSGVSIHTARMRLEKVTKKDLIEMGNDAKRAARLLATAQVNNIIYGCTTGSLVGGVEWEKRLVHQIKSLTGIQTFSTGIAVVDAIKALKGKNVAVATPYTNDLNELECSFLESHGIKVGAVKGLGLISNLDIGKTRDAEVLDLVRSISKEGDLVFISCTNLPTIHLIEYLERELNKPVVSSNQASFWAAIRDSEIDEIIGYGQLLLLK